MVSRVEEDHGLKLWYSEKGQETNASADVILVAVGRKPTLGNLGLDEAGILYDRRGIKVDGDFKTNLDNVYAIGDVTGQMMLAHSATFSGYQVLKNILGESKKIDFSVLPSCIFSFPEVASVGLTEDEAAGKDFKVRKAYFRANGKAATMGETDGFVKIISVSGLIKGVHILGPHASDLISEAVVLINKKTTALEFQDFIHPHPTLSEIFSSALRD
jgi:dihydrolipoamide dehydrogenase